MCGLPGTVIALFNFKDILFIALLSEGLKEINLFEVKALTTFLAKACSGPFLAADFKKYILNLSI